MYPFSENSQGSHGCLWFQQAEVKSMWVSITISSVKIISFKFFANFHSRQIDWIVLLWFNIFNWCQGHSMDRKQMGHCWIFWGSNHFKWKRWYSFQAGQPFQQWCIHTIDDIHRLSRGFEAKNSIHWQLCSEMWYFLWIFNTQISISISKNISKSHIFTVKEANVDAFMNLVNNPAYPSEQRVLRLKELPLECTEKDIRKYFSGLSQKKMIFFSSLDRNNCNVFIFVWQVAQFQRCIWFVTMQINFSVRHS